MRGRPGHIFNLGHGVPPSAKLEYIESLVARCAIPMSTLKVDLGLVQKYNMPGPRYTSYPPATQFTDAVSRAELFGKMRANAQSDRRLVALFSSPLLLVALLVLWLHHRHHRGPKGQRPLHRLSRRKNWPSPSNSSIRSAKSSNFIWRRHSHFPYPGRDPGLGPNHSSPILVRTGCGKPGWRSIRAGLIASIWWRCAKSVLIALPLACRITIPKVQKAVHRIQPFEQTKQVVDWIREAGFASLNIDLIYGLPFQTAGVIRPRRSRTSSSSNPTGLPSSAMRMCRG